MSDLLQAPCRDMPLEQSCMEFHHRLLYWFFLSFHYVMRQTKSDNWRSLHMVQGIKFSHHLCLLNNKLIINRTGKICCFYRVRRCQFCHHIIWYTAIPVDLVQERWYYTSQQKFPNSSFKDPNLNIHFSMGK